MHVTSKLLERYEAAYRAGNPEISDAEFDSLLADFAAEHPNHPFLNKVGQESDFGVGKVKHQSPMLSTDKAYTVDEIEKFVNKVQAVGFDLGIDESEILFRLTPKLDGMAGKEVDRKLVTRGDGLIGNDISSAKAKGVFYLGDGRDAVGEVVMTQAYFDRHMKDEFSHPRNVVVGAVSADEPNPATQAALSAGVIRFVPYYTLKASEVTGTQLLISFDALITEAKKTEYPIDGVVIEVTNEAIKKAMGSTSHHHNWQIAKKERGEAFECYVEGITWQIGRTGRVTPVINITPTKISGAMVSNVTGHHAGNILEKGIGPGAIIEVIRSGEVIPFLSKVVKKSDDVRVPHSCPSCSNPLVTIEHFIECENSRCEAQAHGKVIHWFKTLGNVDGFGPSAVEKLLEAGYDTPPTIYRNLTELSAINAGFGAGQAKNLMLELARSKADRINDWQFLAAFGIHRLGRGDSKKLLKCISIFDLINVTEDFLLNIDGFGPISSKSISEEINERIGEINNMLSLGFNLEFTGTQEVKESPITGQHIVFTGGMVKGTRDDMKLHAESLGAIPQSSINKKTQILVAGNKASAAKIGKAEGFGAKVFDEDSYLEFLGE